jgi:hypothetical protein
MTACDLCGLDCGSRPFDLATPAATLHFCCEGCRGIYEMLHDIQSDAGMSTQNTQDEANRPERK